MVAGFVLLFVPIPVLGNSLRPLSWVLILLGVILLAIPSLLAHLRKVESSLNSGGQSPAPNPFTSGRLNSQPRQWSAGESIHFGRTPSDVRQKPTLTDRQPAVEWSERVFRDIEWRRFEAVCELLFCQAGFTAKSQSHGADGGVDIWLYSKHTTGPAAIVQCKHWRSKPVGVKELREFYGVMASHKLARGTYATSSTFTVDALRFAKDNGINAMDGNRLLDQIAQRNPEQQRALLDVAYEGEFWRPTCASCGVKMVERGKPNKRFWGCFNYPKCSNTLNRAAD